MTVNLPKDMLKIAPTKRLTRYAELEQACRNSMAERVDLAYHFYLEMGQESRHWMTELVDRFAEEGLRTPNIRTLRDDLKIFELFRSPDGFGFTRAQVSEVGYARLRVLAQNREWAMENKALALEMLNDPDSGENKIRAAIRESKGLSSTTTNRLAFNFKDEKQASQVTVAIADVAKRLEKEGQPVPEPSEILLGIIAEWRTLKKAAVPTHNISINAGRKK